ncbi:GTP-binding protein [Nonlabens sp.]|uniref:GTP-binding protein n=1 Tax=Nonlabens sp. TaxID=1888209 RepID=UPI003F698BF1
MDVTNDIVLRPRFKRELCITRDVFFELILTHKKDKKYIISVVNDHVFIRFPKNKSHFWSPELHLELHEVIGEKISLKGLYGPKPTVWTMFMFLHFLVAGLFIAAAIWLYTSYTLEESVRLPLIILILMILVWIILYIAGRLGRKTGESQMHELQYFIDSLLIVSG